MRKRHPYLIQPSMHPLTGRRYRLGCAPSSKPQSGSSLVDVIYGGKYRYGAKCHEKRRERSEEPGSVGRIPGMEHNKRDNKAKYLPLRLHSERVGRRERISQEVVLEIRERNQQLQASRALFAFSSIFTSPCCDAPGRPPAPPLRPPAPRVDAKICSIGIFLAAERRVRVVQGICVMDSGMPTYQSR